MNHKLKMLICFLIFLVNQKVIAQTILVPERTINYNQYLSQCQKPGYKCSHNYAIDILSAMATPKFELLIENMDLMSDDFRHNLSVEILDILKTELISVDQLKTLIELSEKSLQIEQNKKILFLKNELQQLSKYIDSTYEANTAELTYIVFKKKLSESQFLKIKYLVKNYLYYKVTAYSLTDKKSEPTYFLSGTCEHNQLASFLTDQNISDTLLPYFNSDCTFATEVQKSLTAASNTIVEYKQPLIWTAIAAAAYLFSKNYEIDFK